MRVLQVMSGAAHGGAETFFVSLAAAFARAGVEQRAVIRANDGRQAELEAAGIHVSALSFRRRFDFATPRALRRIARDFRPHIALTWMNRASSMLPPGGYVHVARLGGFYDIKYYRRARHLVCNTRGIVDHVAAQGWPRERASYIPNFAHLPEEPAADRRAHDTPEEVPLLLALGRLHENKALDVLLQALARIPEAYLWIAGEGPERGNLERLAHDLGVAGRVRFLGWRRDRGALFAAADICAFPSRREPFGNVVVEAWASRTPLAAAAAEGPGELVRDGEDGLLAPVDDADALATALDRLVREPGLRERLAEEGYRRYQSEFTEEVCVRAYLDLFENLLAERPAAD
ncbi:MAG: glycosyltransferase [Rhodovibrionaceae bacterium]|nr:glycosyltransferase [Rhodovibrionaceae bacterium]